jgi:hypothetical protein
MRERCNKAKTRAEAPNPEISNVHAVSAEELVHLLPPRPLLSLLALVLDQRIDVQLADARVQIHVVRAHDRGAVVELVRDVKRNRHRESEVHLEEALQPHRSRQLTVPERRKRNPELRDQYEQVEAEPDVGPDQPGLAAEGQLG